MPIITPASPDNKSIKKTADTLENLVEAAKQFNQETSRQTKKLIQRTQIIIWLTLVMVTGLVIQILLAYINA